MPDIAMCIGKGCDKRNTCYRHTAQPSFYQTYFAPNPVGCEHYWPTEPGGVRRSATFKVKENGNED